jgi:hypothetical protein
MRSALVAAALTLAATAAALAQSGTVQRCEAKDGKVTYSNTQCPPGTAPVRKVNTDPPISVEAREAAQAQARKDAAALKKADKERAEQEARERKQAEARARADDKASERCERARRDLERAQATRAEVGRRASTVEQMQKADREVGRRETEAEKACPR